MDVGVQMLVERKSIKETDLGSVSIYAAGVGGTGLVIKAEKLSPRLKHAIGAGGDALGGAAQPHYRKSDVSLAETMADVAVGRVAGILGGVVEEEVKNSPQVKQLVRAANCKSRIAANATEAGNMTSARRRAVQAVALNAQVTDRIASRSTAVSTVASRADSAGVERVKQEVEEMKRCVRKGG